MLNYSIKLGDKYLKKDKVVWGEKYLSPDLSFVTGVTSQDYHLDKLTQIEASINGKADLLNIECENVTREGYIVVRGKKYHKDGSIVYINGKYYDTTSGSDVKIDNWLTPSYAIRKDYDGDYFVPSTKEKSVNPGESVDTIYWIENGKVTIDGNEYFFDKDEMTENGTGALKYFEDGVSLSPKEVTDCNSIEFYPFEKSKDFINVTKFRLEKSEDREFEVENVTFINHFFYAFYDEKYCPIEINSSGKYVCKIDGTYHNVVQLGEDGAIVDTEVTTSDVLNYEDLINDSYAVSLSDECNIMVQSTVQNSNSGKKIGVYLKESYDMVSVGESITARRNNFGEGQDIVVDSITEGNKLFVVYDGTRYDVVNALIQTVTINGVEYEIRSKRNDDWFVYIDGELVPMKYENNKLKRYGLILTNGSETPTEATYNINSYSGITIGGKEYRVSETNVGSNKIYSISFESDIVYKLTVKEIIGSSLLVCEPLLNEEEYWNNTEFVDYKIKSISEDLVQNFTDFTFFRKNPLFGDREVLPNMPVGSTYYQDVLNNLILYANIGYITIPLKLEAEIALNHMIDDTRDVDFVKEETQKAINPIVDMERDVYAPKYIENSDESIDEYIKYISPNVDDDENDKEIYEELRHSYIGSFTDFKPVTEIQINPHFRTRNMENWKINDGYNDVSTSGKTDSWFITDYEPYKSIIKEGKRTEGLINVPDLLGLLYFTNIDVFYQKSSVAKSFMRLSYYDSTNPQIQSLLHTSTVFMDEHRIFKKYVDNSKKNIYDYILAEEPRLEEHTENTDEFEIHPSILNKVSVMSEFIGIHDKNKARRTSQGQCGDGNDCYKYTDAKPEEENNRISSRFTIKNKYETDTSSEGFYLYIFKQYAENLHPKPIYMKVDFNHAKIGKTIPFNIPMKWDNDASDSPYVYPTERITISDEKDTSDTGATSDLDLLKEGIPLSYVYGQSYIPLYAMYDFKNKEYSYVFDDRYADVDFENGKVRLNLFELKIKNNEDADNIEKTAAININEKQIKAQ
jgi:uncharacterized protein (UPF0248 family)